jgi:hypothetical protein
MDYRIYGPLAHAVKHTKGSGVATIFGKTVELVGANDVRAEEKIRGSTIEIAYVDEATLLPPGFWEMLISRLRVVGALLLATTNPGSTRHWLRVEWILKAAAKNMQVFHFVMDDNPSLTEDYVRDMKASFTGVFYDRMIKGLWTNAEGAVFDSWDPDKHVIPHHQLPRMERILGVGVDYGTTNATSALMLGVGVDRKMYVIDEWRHDARANQVRITNGAIVKGITDWLDATSLPDGTRPAPEWIILDPSAASLRVEMSSQGVNNLMMSGDNNVLYGIQTVSTGAGRGQAVRLGPVPWPHRGNERILGGTRKRPNAARTSRSRRTTIVWTRSGTSSRLRRRTGGIWWTLPGRDLASRLGDPCCASSAASSTATAWSTTPTMPRLPAACVSAGWRVTSTPPDDSSNLT